MNKIKFSLEPDADGYPPVDVESCWVDDLGDNKYKIANIPFFAKGVALGDVVFGKDIDGELWYDSPGEYSGHSTLRVVFFEEAKELVPEVREKLKLLGCSSELSHLPNLIAVDVPESRQFDSVVGFLATYEQEGLIEVEEACIG